MSTTGGFKNCPICGEQIRQEAIKCRFCAKWLQDRAASTTSVSPHTQGHSDASDIKIDATPIEPLVECSATLPVTEPSRLPPSNVPTLAVSHSQIKSGVDVPESPEPRLNYLLQHWYGLLPLPRAYWVNTYLLGLGMQIANRVLDSTIVITSLLGSAAYIISFWLITLVVTLWQFVGVWRSASIHKGRGWAIVAKCVVVLSVTVSWVILYRTGLPQMQEAVSMVSGDSKFEDFKVTVLPSGKEVEFHGGFKLGAAKKLSEVLASTPYVTTIHIDSFGGRLAEALEMAKIIKEKNLNTYTGNICASAAVIPFLAGKERIARQDAMIGFHSITFAGERNEAGQIFFAKILKDAGVSQAFITRVTKSHEFTYPQHSELLKERILTTTKFGQQGLGTRDLSKHNIDAFRKDTLEVSMYAALSSLKGYDFEVALQAGFKRLTDGGTLVSGATELNALLLSTVAERWSLATDDALLKWAEYIIDLIENNMELNPKAVLQQCNNDPSANMEGPGILKFLPKYPVKRQQDLYAALLSGSTPVTEKMKESGKQSVENVFSQFTAGEIDLISQTPLPKDPKDYLYACKLNLKYMRLIRGDKNFYNIARHLVAQ